jgi:hypothetical protein
LSRTSTDQRSLRAASPARISAIYDLDGRGWYFQWSALISMVVIIALGLVAFRVLQRQRNTGRV